MNLDRSHIIYAGLSYTIVSVLENNLVLTVKTSELDSKTFPLSTYILPDPLSE